jgi:hypothetical protein
MIEPFLSSGQKLSTGSLAIESRSPSGKIKETLARPRYTLRMIPWVEIATAFLAYVFVGWAFVILYLAIQWFIQATDVTMDYNWRRVGAYCNPILRFKNRSNSRTYLLTTIAYRSAADGLVWFDAKSLMGKELMPRSIYEFQEISPVRNCSLISECLQMQVRVRLQTGKEVWLESEEVGMGRIQRAAFQLRAWVENWGEQ